MTPYYSDSLVTLYHGDCRDILPQLGRVDVAVTDPPYGVSLTTKTSDFRDSPFYDGGESIRASVLYEDSPEHVTTLIGQVMPVLLGMADRVVVFSGARMLFRYPEPTAIGAVFTPNGAGRSPWGFQCSHPILYYGKDPYLADGLGSRPNGFRTEQPNSGAPHEN